MNRDEANRRNLALSIAGIETVVGTQVPPEKLQSVISAIMLKDNEVIDKHIDEMVNDTLDKSIDFTRGNLLNVFPDLENYFRASSGHSYGFRVTGVIMHPSAWRGVKRIMLKNKAKRRAKVRMRSRGYAAHGRHG